MCLVTERLRSREGVRRPEGTVGVVRPLAMPGDGIVDEVGDIGAVSCVETMLSPGFGDGLGEDRGARSPGRPGAVKDFELKYV